MMSPRAKGAFFTLVVVALGTTLPGLSTYFLKDDLSLAMFTAADGTFVPRAFFDQLIWPTARTWDDIWRPVPALSWGLDYLFFGANATAFHIWNIVGHVVNVLLLEALLRRLVTGSHAARGAFVGALLFALYPLAPEAILWTTQRTVIFGLGFSLAALVLWLDWLREGHGRKAVLAFLCAGCGLLSREHALAVLPLFAWLGLQYATAATRRRAVLMALIGGAALGAIYFCCRWLIFGRFSGGYSGWPSMSAYAADNKTFEQLMNTARLLVMPVAENSEGIPSAVSSACTIVLGLSAALGVCACLRGHATARGLRGLALTSSLWLVFSWLPVAFVFIIFPNLLNGRSAYHLMALPLGCIGMGLSHVTPRGWLTTMLLAPVLCVTFFLFTHGIGRYAQAGDSVRGLQQALLSNTTPQDVVLVVDVPTEHRAAPTVDSYLSFLMKQPYTADERNAVACVVGRNKEWPALIAAAQQDANQRGASLRWQRALPHPPWAEPLWPVPQPASGATVSLLAPADGLHCGRSAPAPVIRTRLPAGTAALTMNFEVPGRKLAVPVPMDALQSTGVGEWSIPLTTVLASAGIRNWPLPESVFDAADPLVAAWSISALDAHGTGLGQSETRHFVLTRY
jgi:hypothetical protein